MTSEDREHSTLGGSGAERWMECPGSNVLLDALDLPQSDEADYQAEGTAAHEVAAHCLLNGLDAWEVMHQEFHGVICSEDMATAVQVYLDDVRQFMTPTATVMIEAAICEDLAKRPHPKFYGHVDFASYDTDVLVVEDYKHGQGIVVEPEWNAQLLYYAFGIIYPRVGHIRSDRIVLIRVCQPRAFHPDGPIREWSTTVGEIVLWAETKLIPAMKAAEIEKDLKTGDWCRFCPAKLFCPLLSGLYGAAMRADPNFVPNFGNERLAQEYMQREAVKFYMTALDKEVLRRNTLGNTVPGTQLEHKKANRVWKAGAEPIFKGRFGDKAVSPAELKSPAEMEKISSDAKELVHEWAFMPQTDLTVGIVGKSKKQAVKVEKAVDIFAAFQQTEDPRKAVSGLSTSQET